MDLSWRVLRLQSTRVGNLHLHDRKRTLLVTHKGDIGRDAPLHDVAAVVVTIDALEVDHDPDLTADDDIAPGALHVAAVITDHVAGDDPIDGTLGVDLEADPQDAGIGDRDHVPDRGAGAETRASALRFNLRRIRTNLYLPDTLLIISTDTRGNSPPRRTSKNRFWTCTRSPKTSERHLY